MITNLIKFSQTYKQGMNKKRIGLALSGGGYRASAFHLGTLKKLHELNLLGKIDVISTISGGSITGAAYCLNQLSYEEFQRKMIQVLQTKSVIKYIFQSWIFLRLILLTILILVVCLCLYVTKHSWAVAPVLLIYFVTLFKFQFIVFPVSEVVTKAYDNFFYHEAQLDDLCKKPELAIGATNLQTGRPFTFSKRKMGDSTYAYMSPPIYYRGKIFPLAQAVTASSCVPFVFSPISIAKKYYYDSNDAIRVNPQIIDGGVYDNQGIQKLTQPGSSYECNIIITSDAGNKLPFEGHYNNTLILLIRTVDVFMARIKNFQMAQNLYQSTGMSNKQIAYLSLGWDIENCIPEFIRSLKNKTIPESLIEAHKIPEQWAASVDQFQSHLAQHLERIVNYDVISKKSLSNEKLNIARNVSTNLKTLSKNQIDYLISHAENLTELQLKLYCPLIFAV